ncbi:MAG: type I 3-dehydroquinate dehydratase [Fibromonadaceae bacterium]|jgi:3-dehydroquinate dehydratase-1|nr:type I 3-dehydroquinate dehydratase [Fibromonadaceae bacterium]
MNLRENFIAGLISPEVLQNALENAGAEAAAIKKCGILEIRYDLFKKTAEWNELSQKVSELNPKALRLGTIRLEKDGGMFKNNKTERLLLFSNKDLDWIDVERGEDFSLAKSIGKKIICSWHLFDRVPSEQELSDFADECLELKVQGCKVAAMAHSKNDVQPLYDFAKKYGKKFELFSAFAMGEHGKESRIRSLKEGANLTYASIGKALAPGQLSVEEINKKFYFQPSV